MTPSRCPNCGFASLFLDPFLLSRMRVGVWDTSTLFVQVDFSKAWAMEHGGRTPLFSGNGPNGQALPHCGTCSSLRGAFSVLPVAELLVVDARTSAACPKQPSTKSTSQERNRRGGDHSMVAFETLLFSTPFPEFRRPNRSHGWSLLAAPTARRRVLHMHGRLAQARSCSYRLGAWTSVRPPSKAREVRWAERRTLAQVCYCRRP